MLFCANETLLVNGTDPDIQDLDSANTSTATVSKLVNYYITDIAMPATCALGILGNLLSLMVLTTEKLHRTLSKMEISAHIGLTALAVSDFLFCLLVLIVTQVPPKNYFEIGDPVIYFHLMSNGLITIFIISSTWLIVVMAAERYIAVCHPLQARKLISLRRTRTSIVLVFLICTVATIPIFLEMTIQDACADGRVVRELMERDKEAPMPMKRLLWSIFFDFIPCAALVYFNLCLIIQIRKAKKLREQMTPKHSIVRYSSSNSKDNHPKHNTLPVVADLNGKKGAGPLPHRTRGRKGLLDNTLAPGDARQIEMTNGANKYMKFVANRPKESRSQENDSLGNESTQNEFRCLNDIPKPARSFRSPSSQKLRMTESTIRKRPSDNALNSVTATLVAVILLFLILVSPSEMLKFSVEHTSADESQKKIVTSVTNFMQVLNFSLNFVLYCAVNKTFRHTLYGLVCCCWLTLSRR